MNSAGKRYADRGKSSIISHLLNEHSDNCRRQMELKGIKPKNHHRDNLKNIAAIQRLAKRDEAQRARQALQRNKKCAKYARTESKLKQLCGHKAVSAQRSSTNFMAKNRCEVETQSTLNSSRKAPRPSRRVKPAVPLRSRGKAKEEAQAVDFLARNRQLSRSTQLRGEAAAAAAATAETRFVRKKDYGRVPEYMVQRKLRREQDEQKAMEEAEAAKIPAGMRRMTREEREETLQILAANKAQLLQQIKNLPLIIETPSMKRRQAALNRQMDDVEKNIVLFGKPTVFIALDE